MLAKCISARDNHVFASNFAKYSLILKLFSLSHSAINLWLLTIPPHLKYVAILPSNLSLIARFPTLMFHVLAWQHMQGVVEILINRFTSNLPRNLSVKKFGRSVKNHQNYGHEFVASFFGPPCMHKVAQM